ncbi:54S ribosomal protein L6 mitochondrial [Coemansia sp. RSA 1813]|nr:54S ribosomal protein L6 mitochondrial [Coemansia sp. RSA 1646]KAJ1770285.1 54S ribosomal protein L6 mitochondrial [Coemansia sp. RSA 1843]KAJ2087546.1 54S ribosomal protein L6 mitochondrial [Coemansia sp. RSA 986]KAJ2211487.1 54S ribosomal protein L6 mitochondrial [Coemansia sp. RSA 487]KAJ2569916.1 54S ribosomal protein L6 mitochondrial [Coemansia sp. RSA 1813]
MLSTSRRIRQLSCRQLRGFSSTRLVKSHIGKAPIKYTNEVKVEHLPEAYSKTDSRFFDKTTLRVTGPMGERTMAIEPFVKLDFVEPKDKTSAEAEYQVTVSVANSELKNQRQMWGTTRALISNCVVGVTEGFSATLRFVGVGYRAGLESGKLVLRLGYSHPIAMAIPEGLTVSVPVPTRVLIRGIDLQQVKLFAAKVREWKKPEPYNQKGIFIDDETIRKKDGKKK